MNFKEAQDVYYGPRFGAAQRPAAGAWQQPGARGADGACTPVGAYYVGADGGYDQSIIDLDLEGCTCNGYGGEGSGCNGYGGYSDEDVHRLEEERKRIMIEV